MPHPVERVAVRAAIRDAITELMERSPTEAELEDRLTLVGTVGGRVALDEMASLIRDGMRALREASPGAQLGGIAGFLQTSGDRFGEPHASIRRRVLDGVRHLFTGETLDAAAALDDVWQRWGDEALGHAAACLVLLYDHTARATGVSVQEAWAKAAADDEERADRQLGLDES